MTHPFNCFCPHCRGEIDDPNVVQSYRTRQKQEYNQPPPWHSNGNCCEWCGLAHDPAGREFCQAALDAVRASGVRHDSMNVGAYAQNTGGDFPPLLDAKTFKKEAKGKPILSGKVLAVREIHSKPKKGKKPFNGIALDMRINGTKYGFLTSFERFDIGAIVAQLGSAETDDWIGETLKFVAKKSSKGGTFVNVAQGKSK